MVKKNLLNRDELVQKVNNYHQVAILKRIKEIIKDILYIDKMTKFI